MTDGKKQIRIDLACYHPRKDLVVFVEAECGPWAEHPISFTPFADATYLAYDSSVVEVHQEEQVRWASQKGLGVIEVDTERRQCKKLVAAKLRQVDPIVRHEIRELLFKKIRLNKGNLSLLTQHVDRTNESFLRDISFASPTGHETHWTLLQRSVAEKLVIQDRFVPQASTAAKRLEIVNNKDE